MEVTFKYITVTLQSSRRTLFSKWTLLATPMVSTAECVGDRRMIEVNEVPRLPPLRDA